MTDSPLVNAVDTSGLQRHLLLYEDRIEFLRPSGNYDLNMDWNRTKVGMKQLASTCALPMWCAVPFASKSRTF